LLLHDSQRKPHTALPDAGNLLNFAIVTIFIAESMSDTTARTGAITSTAAAVAVAVGCLLVVWQ